jgi:hypothetical protein
MVIENLDLDYDPFIVTYYHLPHHRVPHEQCFRAPFVSIIAPWDEVANYKSV